MPRRPRESGPKCQKPQDHQVAKGRCHQWAWGQKARSKEIMSWDSRVLFLLLIPFPPVLPGIHLEIQMSGYFVAALLGVRQILDCPMTLMAAPAFLDSRSTFFLPGIFLQLLKLNNLPLFASVLFASASSPLNTHSLVCFLILQAPRTLPLWRHKHLLTMPKVVSCPIPQLQHDRKHCCVYHHATDRRDLTYLCPRLFPYDLVQDTGHSQASQERMAESLRKNREMK